MSSAYNEIIRLCELRHVKQTTLERELGWGRGSIGKMKTAKKNPSVDKLQAVADYFGVTLEEVAGKGKDVSEVTRPKTNTAQFNVNLFAGTAGLKITKRIPVLGRVAAGIPITAIEEILDYEEISGEMVLSGEYFGLRIQGDSMEPRICNGDVVIVRQQENAETGDTIIALVNGDDAVCKKLKWYEDGSLALVSLNSAYQPMFFSSHEVTETPVKILGKVVELRAKF